MCNFLTLTWLRLGEKNTGALEIPRVAHGRRIVGAGPCCMGRCCTFCTQPKGTPIPAVQQRKVGSCGEESSMLVRVIFRTGSVTENFARGLVVC